MANALQEYIFHMSPLACEARRHGPALSRIQQCGLEHRHTRMPYAGSAANADGTTSLATRQVAGSNPAGPAIYRANALWAI